MKPAGTGVNRRAFLAALPLLPTVLTARPATASSSAPQPWRVRFVAEHAVVDVATGRDVSCEFPLSCGQRLRRSRETGRPVRVVLFELGADGRHFVLGDRIARRPAWVQVVR